MIKDVLGVCSLFPLGFPVFSFPALFLALRRVACKYSETMRWIRRLGVIVSSFTFTDVWRQLGAELAAATSPPLHLGLSLIGLSTSASAFKVKWEVHRLGNKPCLDWG